MANIQIYMNCQRDAPDAVDRALLAFKASIGHWMAMDKAHAAYMAGIMPQFEDENEFVQFRRLGMSYVVGDFVLIGLN